MTRFKAFCVVGVLAIGGCEPSVSIKDDIDGAWDFSSLQTAEDARLHSPYVLGAQMALSARSSDDDAGFRGWSIVSSDPAVFRIDAERTKDGALGSGHAVGEGTTTLRLFDDGAHEVYREDIEVAAPDRMELDAPGPMFLGNEAEAIEVQPRVVEGGIATFLIRYFQGERELQGQRALQVESPPGIVASRSDSALSERREWLTLVVIEPTTEPILLRVGEVTALLSVLQVPETEVAAVVLQVQPEQGRVDGDLIVASAQAVDASGAPVFGVEYGWDASGLDGGEGGFYRYRLKRDRDATLVAHGGVDSAALTIHADQGTVVPVSGCSTGGSGSLFVGLAALGLVGVRRRRRR